MISICIPSRGEVAGLWATIAACELLLIGRSHEYIVIRNGHPESAWPDGAIRQDSTGMRLSVGLSADALPPPIARNKAAADSSGDVIYFLDDHCIPLPEFFDEPPFDDEINHAVYSANFGQTWYYHSLLNRETPTKADYSRNSKSTSPYTAVSGSSGAFWMTRKTWEKIGGYDEFWQGFGGEEVYLDLKAQMLGCSVWIHPRRKYFHFSCRPEVRGYDKTFNEWNFKEGLRRLKAGFPNQVRSLDEILASNQDWL